MSWPKLDHAQRRHFSTCRDCSIRPSLNIVLLLASTMIRIAATVVAGVPPSQQASLMWIAPCRARVISCTEPEAALGYAAWFLIDKRREAECQCKCLVRGLICSRILPVEATLFGHQVFTNQPASDSSAVSRFHALTLCPRTKVEAFLMLLAEN